eukprot:6260165-Prymnesium_polylepis.1
MTPPPLPAPQPAAATKEAAAPKQDVHRRHTQPVPRRTARRRSCARGRRFCGTAAPLTCARPPRAPPLHLPRRT